MTQPPAGADAGAAGGTGGEPPWTSGVAALLSHLTAAGVPNVPHPHDDAGGAQVIDLMPAAVGGAPIDALSVGRLSSLGRWMRLLHGALDSFSHPGPWQFPEVERATIITHNDLRPSKLLFSGTDLVAVLGWDLAGPSSPLLDLAQVAWTCVPLARDAQPEHAAARLEVLATAYGTVTAREIYDAVETRVQLTLGGDEPATSAEALQAFLQRAAALEALL